MPSPPRVGETCGTYHALNRGIRRATIVLKDVDENSHKNVSIDMDVHCIAMCQYVNNTRSELVWSGIPRLNAGIR